MGSDDWVGVKGGRLMLYPININIIQHCYWLDVHPYRRY